MSITLLGTDFIFIWDHSNDDHGIAFYDVALDQVIIGQTDPETLWYHVEGLEPGRAYSMTVRALDIDGLYSGWSVPLVVITGAGETESQVIITRSTTWDVDGPAFVPAVFQNSLSLGYQGPRQPVAWNGASQHMFESVTNKARDYAVSTTEVTAPAWAGGFGYTATSTSNAPFTTFSDFVRPGLVLATLYVDAEATNKYQMAVLSVTGTTVTQVSRVPYPSQTFAASGFIRGWIAWPDNPTVLLYGTDSTTHAIEVFSAVIDVAGVIGTPTSLGAVTYHDPGDIPGGGAYYFTLLHDALVISDRLAMDDLRGLYDRLNPNAITDVYSRIPTTSGDSNTTDQFVSAPRAAPGHLLVKRRNTGNTLTTKVLDVMVSTDGSTFTLNDTWTVPGGGAFGVVVGFTSHGKAVAYTYDNTNAATGAYYDIFGTEFSYTPFVGVTVDGSSYLCPTDPAPLVGDTHTYDSWLVGLTSGSSYAMVLEQYPLT